MSTMYTIICVTLGETTPFPVDIASNQIVGHLKEAIKEKKPNRFASVDADQLDLYRVEIPDNEDVAKAVEQKFSEHPAKLRPTTKLATVFKDVLKEGTVHIIVQPPKSDKELKLQKPIDPKFVNHVDAVKFFTTSVGIYTLADLTNVSNNTHLHKGAHVTSTHFPGDSLSDGHQTPSFVSLYLEKLDKKRPASQAQLQQLQQLPEIFGQTKCEDHFEDPGPEEREMSSIELHTYTVHLRSHHPRLSTIQRRSSAFKDGHVTVFLVDPALTDDEGEAWCYNKDVAWNPLLLQGTLTDHEDLYNFKPRSDFSLIESTYGPLILGEIVSEGSESDRWRMLFQGIAVCRYQNMIRGGREAVILCLYLNKHYQMERYLVYQDADTNPRDVHVLHDLTLDLTKIPNTFLLSKQLFNFRQRLIQIPDEEVQKRAAEALEIQKEIEKVYHTSVTAAKKRLKSEGGRRSRAAATTLGPISEDAVLQASFKAIHVLNRNQKDVAAAIRRSDMQSVVLKRIRTNSSELHIVRLLQFYASRGSNHIIPLLDVVERPPGISTLVMPYYTPILDLKKGRAEDLALQLIRGVDWLHKQLISHSDIKERNLVIDERQNCLFIIDFGLAVKLSSREQRVRGARGTPEHVAPEVGITSSWESCLEEVFLDEESIYSPILADVWAVGDVINHFHERFRSSTESIRTVVEKVAKELQAVDPIKRLSLQEAERRIAAECSTVATAPGPPAEYHWIHHTVSTVALQA